MRYSPQAASIKNQIGSLNPWTEYQGYKAFAAAIGTNKPWDMKPYIYDPVTMSVLAVAPHCPTCKKCVKYVTVCNNCLDYRIPGNIVFGYIARYLGIGEGVALLCADWVHIIEHDELNPTFQEEAIQCGFEIFNLVGSREVTRTQLCYAISIFLPRLLPLSKICPPCRGTWFGSLPPSPYGP